MIDTLKIGVIGDYDINKPSHQATNNALQHSANFMHIGIETHWLPTDALETYKYGLQSFDAFFCAPGSPYISPEGAMNAIQFARENNIPFLGTCGGFQHAVMEYAKNVLMFSGLAHQEYDPDASSYIISALPCTLKSTSQSIVLKKDTAVFSIYGADMIEEKYNCSFGLNNCYTDAFLESGFHISGMDKNGEVRIMELHKKRFYIITLFQPQLSSISSNPHKLITAYLLAAQKYHCERKILK